MPNEGRGVGSVAHALGIGPVTLAAWARQARIDRKERKQLSTGERAEPARLRR